MKIRKEDNQNSEHDVQIKNTNNNGGLLTTVFRKIEPGVMRVIKTKQISFLENLDTSHKIESAEK